MTVTELVRPAAEPPPARVRRWVPARAGILNVWRYYDEIFVFHDGRLLLRGPNGSGKSKALELLLPFLLDANLRASRLSTFGTSERTMYWNLMGEGASATTRVGYVWLEFRFAGDEERWFSCGCRLQASAHATTVRADYFTTSLRIGTDGGLSLINEASQPLTRDALEEALGEHGTLYGNAGDYRTAVRHGLFPGLTEQRYEALMTALLQLRMPKLSQRLDPGVLSTLLSHALPPLGQREIADLAEGFERLDQQRERLVTLDEEVKAARTLADRQRTYARRVLRAASAALISATSALDTLTRTARLSAEEYERIAAERTETERLITALDSESSRCAAEIDGMKESEAYQQGRELDQLRQQVAAQRERGVRLRADATQKRAKADADRDAARVAERTCEQRAENLSGLESQASQAAVRAQLTGVHAELAEAAKTDQGGGRQLLRAAVRARFEQIAAVRKALDEHARAVGRRQDAESDLEEARAEFGRARERQKTASESYEAALADLTTRLARWIGSCRELMFPDPDAVLVLAESEPALIGVVEGVASAVLEDIARAETHVANDRAITVAERGRKTDEFSELTASRDQPPAAPVTRTADRKVMAGAPFWRVVDFAEGVPPQNRGGIEAALTAAGLLDAWVGPGGSVEGHDTFADPAALAPAPGRSLADVLVPEKDSPVPADAVRRLLTSIAYGDQLPAAHPAAVGADGRWRLGNVHGSWHKDQPAHIGAAARERARQERLRELAAEIASVDQVIAAFDTELAGLGVRRGTVASERALRPGHAELADAAQALNRAEADLAAADGAVRRRIEIVRQREADVVQALRKLIALASGHGLPTEPGALDTLAEAIERFSTQAEHWLDEVSALASARRDLSALLDKAAGSRVAAAEREAEADEAEDIQARLAAKLAAIEGTVGAEYRDVLSRLMATREELAGLTRRIEATRAELNQLTMRLGQLESARASDADARDKATGDRDAAAQRFRHLVAGVLAVDSGLFGPAGSEDLLSGSDGVRAALEAARRIAAAWPSVPHAAADLSNALHRLEESVHACRTSLSARADLDLEADAEVQVFTAVIDGIRTGAAELRRRLEEDAERSRDEITERERELFDRTLTGDTRRHLADLIRQANELVDRMNARLERVRTASKVAVRLVWQVAPELPAGTRAARDLLLKDPVRLTDADRDSLHQFFRERIEQAKADNTAASWEQQLQQVFDYTSWHQFVVKIDRSNGTGWQLLTRKLHGALSGGEKAIALHLPLFAAVAAHYQAVPEAPRVILLDEVFVGVDSSNRGQVFALLSALDLDLVLTSDHEWCTYAELGGIAIHQLITGSDGDDAVTTARFTWNGRELTAEEETRS
jgi:uncharacterized protein (TIGR02680 family)